MYHAKQAIFTMLSTGKQIPIDNREQIVTLTNFMGTKLTGKTFDDLAQGARKFLKPFIAKAKKDNNLLNDLQVTVITNPTDKDGNPVSERMIEHYEYTLSAMLALSNLSVNVLQRKDWNRNTGGGKNKEPEPTVDFIAEFGI